MANYFLAGFLILMGLTLLGVGIPDVITGVVALIGGILLLIGR